MAISSKESETRFSIARAVNLYDLPPKQTPGAFIINDSGIPTGRTINTPASPLQVERAMDTSRLGLKPKSRVYFIDGDSVIQRPSLDDPPPGWNSTTASIGTERELALVRENPEHAMSKSGQRQIQKTRMQTNHNNRGGIRPQQRSKRR